MIRLGRLEGATPCVGTSLALQPPCNSQIFRANRTSHLSLDIVAPWASVRKLHRLAFKRHQRHMTQVSVVGSMRPNPASSKLYSGPTAVVIGAGPAGTTAAMHLARHGFQVDIYERRPEPSKDEVDKGRAYIIILIPRGQAALEELGIPLPTDPQYTTKGTVRHRPGGKISVSKESGNVTFSRSDLAQFLIEEAQRRYPEKIRFHFCSECKRVDLDQKQVVFQPIPNGGIQASSGPSTVKYDLLVGADGVRSKVREALVQGVSEFTASLTDSGREYKVYRNLQGDIEPPEFSPGPGSSLHLWTTSSDPYTTVTAHKNPDGTYSGTFSLRTGQFDEIQGLAAHLDLIKSRFPDLPEGWAEKIAQQTAPARQSSVGTRIKCSQLHGPGVVLLGDAAHAVSPVFGQGANSALESSRVLGDVLSQAGGETAQVPDLFTEARRADVHALCDLDAKAYSFFRRRWLLDVDFLQLLSHVVLGFILSKVVPFLYGSTPALLQLGTVTPYSRILKAVRRDSAASLVVVVAVVACLLGKTFMTA